MIKIKLIDKGSLRGKIVVLFADTKDEVPDSAVGMPIAESGSMAEASVALEAGTFLYTAKMEIAVLKSDGSWEWGD